MTTTTDAPTTEVVGALPWVGAFLATLAGRTRENYTVDLRLWVSWLAAEHVDPAAVDRAVIERWAAAGREDGRSPRTVGTRLGHVCGAYRWAWQTGRDEQDRGAGVRRPGRPRPCPRLWLGRDDLHTLLDHVRAAGDVEMSAAVHLWGLAGLRCGETMALDVADLSSHDGQATVRVTRGKGTGTDEVVLAPSAAEAVQAARGDRVTGPLLVNHVTRRRLSASIARKRLARLDYEAGVPPVTPQGLRVGFITLALDAGIDERAVMIAAGHASSAQTALYDRHRSAMSRPVGPRLAAWIDEAGR